MTTGTKYKIPMTVLRDCVFGETDIPSKICNNTAFDNYYELGKFI